MYGSESEGFRYYDEEREYVKASRSQFIHRSVYQLFTSSRYIICVIKFVLLGVFIMNA